jgi:hypothetical protein
MKPHPLSIPRAYVRHTLTLLVLAPAVLSLPPADAQVNQTTLTFTQNFDSLGSDPTVNYPWVNTLHAPRRVRVPLRPDERDDRPPRRSRNTRRRTAAPTRRTW